MCVTGVVIKAEAGSAGSPCSDMLFYEPVCGTNFIFVRLSFLGEYAYGAAA